PFQRLRRQPVERAAVDDAVPVRLVPEHDVRADVEGAGLDQLLAHQRYAEMDGFRRAGGRLPAHRHRPLVRHVGPRRHLHHRRFADAVPADEPDDLTGGDLEIDPLKRLDPAEGFLDPPQLEHFYFCNSLSLVQNAVRFSLLIVSMPGLTVWGTCLPSLMSF